MKDEQKNPQNSTQGIWGIYMSILDFFIPYVFIDLFSKQYKLIKLS